MCSADLFEINEAASLVSDAAHPDANIIFGAVIDDALGDEVRVTVIAAGFDSGRPSSRKDAGAAVTGGAPGAAPAGLPPYRRPLNVPAVPQPVGQRSSTPQQSGAPAASVDGGEAASAPSRAPLPPVGGGITVPPLPPIPGSAQGRRPLSNEDFEEELDIPEFLKQ